MLLRMKQTFSSSFFAGLWRRRTRSHFPVGFLKVCLAVLATFPTVLVVGQTNLQPILNPPEYLTNGTFCFELMGATNRTYVVSATTNLADWQDLAACALFSPPFPFEDTNAAEFSLRFYRAMLFRLLIVSNSYPVWSTAEGRDGRCIAFPVGWVTNSGDDGRAVAYPAGWATAEGADGRRIAYPPGWTAFQGDDGRMVAWPASVFTNAAGGDGRMVSLPSANWTNAQGSDARCVAFPLLKWTTDQGADGRLVAHPVSFFTTVQGADGREVAYSSPGWLIAGGVDGRQVYYSLASFTTTNSSDGRLIAYPSSGWTTTQGADGRIAVYPSSPAAVLELNFQDQAFFDSLRTLQSILSPSTLNDFIIYFYFVAEGQGQSD
jgi:hypothetical protein